MAFFDASSLQLGDLSFQVTSADGTRVHFKELVQGFSTEDHVNTAGSKAELVLVGPIDQVSLLGDEGSSCRVEAPLEYPGGPEVSLLWDGLWDTVTDERGEGVLTRYVTGYDLAKALADNEEDWVFQNKTLSDIVNEVAEEFELPLGTVPTTHTKLGQIIGRGESIWAILSEALQRHTFLTGDAYRILAVNGRIVMRRQGADTSFWTFEVGDSLRTARRERTISQVVNQVKVYGRTEGEERAAVVEEVKDLSSQRLYGLKQRVVYVGGESTVEIMKKRAQYQLDNSRAPDEKMTITGLVVPGLRAGDRVRVVDPEWGVDSLYFAESVHSRWEAAATEASLTLRREAIEPGVDIAEEVFSL